jgi:sortase A
MKKKAGNLVIGIIFLAGLSLLLYPFVANQWNNYRQKQLISGYEQVVSDKEAAEGIDYDAERKKAEDYNEALLPCVLPDSFALAESSGVDPVYMNTLNIAGDEMMGSVEIPKINIKIPIYHTTEEDVLNKGAGHLEGSSLPVGGANTHAVISAHRGLPSASLFTDLDQMKVGDHFLLHVLDETLCYEVDKISVVKPEDTSALAVEDGQDLVTLLTCTPYGVNTHRLLIRGIRTEYVEPEEKAEETPIQQIAKVDPVKIMIIGLVAMVIMIIIVYIVIRRKNRKTEESSRKDE